MSVEKFIIPGVSKTYLALTIHKPGVLQVYLSRHYVILIISISFQSFKIYYC